jgi:hypothetical protein
VHSYGVSYREGCLETLTIGDDRTIHGSGPGVGARPTSPELERAAVLVSMYPRALAKPAVLASRVRAIELGWSGGGGGESLLCDVRLSFVRSSVRLFRVPLCRG